MEIEHPIQIALKEFGNSGKKYLDYFDLPKQSWCGVFVSWVFRQIYGHAPLYTSARQWLNNFEQVRDLKIGDLVILYRDSPDDWPGHVGFYVNHDERGNVHILGGCHNKKDHCDGGYCTHLEVNIEAFPIERILGYTRPFEIKAKEIIGGVK